jgi:hypothetical protein
LYYIGTNYYIFKYREMDALSVTRQSKHEEGDAYLSEIEVWTCSTFKSFRVFFIFEVGYLRTIRLFLIFYISYRVLVKHMKTYRRQINNCFSKLLREMIITLRYFFFGIFMLEFSYFSCLSFLHLSFLASLVTEG